jgi:hypothetical protein
LFAGYSLGSEKVSCRTRPLFLWLAIKMPHHVFSFMPCEERVRLLIAYQMATELQSRAVKQLTASVGAGDSQAFYELQKLSSDTLDQPSRARKELERHRSEHGC